MNGMAGSASIACSSCGHMNLVGAKFCAQCGTPSASVAASPEPSVVQPAATAFLPADAASAAVALAGGEVTQQLAPNRVAYRAPYRGPGSRFNLPIIYSGELTLGDAAGAANATATIDPKSLAMQLGFVAIGAVVVLMLPASIVTRDDALGAIVVAAGATLWFCLSYCPKKMRELLLASVPAAKAGGATTMTSATAPVAAAAVPFAATAAPAATAAAAPAVAASAADPIMADLQRLAELKNLGAITDEEFTAKKAELLARI